MGKNLFDKVFDFNNDGKADLFEIGMGLDTAEELKNEKKKNHIFDEDGNEE